MNIKLIADSCCDLTRELFARLNPTLVPLTISVGAKQFVDNASINLTDLLASMKAHKGRTTTACPAPETYAQEMRQADESYVVTLSSKLSGSHQSASVAKDMVLAEDSSKFIHVFDSKSASSGETCISLKIQEFLQKGLRREALVEAVEHYIDQLKTVFVLESLDNLIKNGRVGRIAGQVASVLSLRPIMGATDGEITLLEKARGTQKALERLTGMLIQQLCEKQNSGPVVIAHCSAPQRATTLRDKLLAACPFIKEIFVVPTAGISTVYANEGGIVVSH